MNTKNWFQRLDCDKIAAFGSCVYVYNIERLRANVAQYGKIVGAENVRVAMKVNDTFALWQELAATGVGADCCSPQEYHTAIHAGILPERISYYCPAIPVNRSNAPEISLLLKILRSGGSIVLDDFGVMQALEAALKEGEVSGKVFLRVNLEREMYKEKMAYQAKTSHGREGAQFGVPFDQAVQIIADSALPITGLHCHIGTMMDNVESYVTAVELLHKVVNSCQNKGKGICHINLGGGLGVGNGFPTIAELGGAIRAKFWKRLTYLLEPGNSIFADAGVLQAQVLSLKGDSRLLDLRGNFKVSLVGFPQPVVHVSKTSGFRLLEAGSGDGHICGNYCFAGDIMLAGVDTSEIKRGDFCILPNMGAYAASMFSNFNGQLRPTQLLYSGGKLAMIVAPDVYMPESLEKHIPLIDEVKERTPVDWGRLSSKYFQTGIVEDMSTYKYFDRVGHNNYEFVVTTNSTLPIVSMPFLIRITGDAVIVAVLDSLGVEEKTKSVLSPRLIPSLMAELPSGKYLKARVAVSTAEQSRKGFMCPAWVVFIGSSPDGKEWTPLSPEKFGVAFQILAE
jgi:diaminopimelate decarboxylase